jgi:hypothetical protein
MTFSLQLACTLDDLILENISSNQIIYQIIFSCKDVTKLIVFRIGIFSNTTRYVKNANFVKIKHWKNEFHGKHILHLKCSQNVELVLLRINIYNPEMWKNGKETVAILQFSPSTYCGQKCNKSHCYSEYYCCCKLYIAWPINLGPFFLTLSMPYSLSLSFPLSLSLSLCVCVCVRVCICAIQTEKGV